MKMTSRFEPARIEKVVVRDENLLFSILCLITILIISLNLLFINSFLLGVVASLLYFSINTLFLGHAFFNREKPLSRVLLGALLLFLLLGLISWITMISYNLDNLRSIVALILIAVLSSALNRRKAKQTEHYQKLTHAKIESSAPEQHTILRFHFARLLFLFLFSVAAYLLLISRTGEVYTVWQVLHPLFMPTYFILTVVLVAIIFSSEKTPLKLLIVIAHSILSHAFLFVIFPAGDIGVQQLMLAVTRRIYENLTLFGYGHSTNVFVQIYYWFNGINLQSAYSVIFARMLSIDVFWIHLALIPFSWGIFVPIISYLIARTLGANETIASLSSLAVLAFPATIYWGAFSVPNTLGFIFGLSSLYFVLRYVSLKDKDSRFVMLMFSFASFISHYLTGMITLALLSLAIAVIIYKKERKVSTMTSRFSIMVAFIFSVSVLPMSLVYHRLLSPLYAVFSLYIWRTTPPDELIGKFIMGEYLGYGPLATAVFVAGPLLGLLGIIYVLRTKNKQSVNDNSNTRGSFFLLLGLLLILADYRILKFFMVDVPFNAERIWIIRDFIAAPFLAILGYSIFLFLRKTPLKTTLLRGTTTSLSHNPSRKLNMRAITAYALMIIAVSGWISASIYYGYPHFAPLQTTSYEIEAVKYLEANTVEKYVVIADQWIIFAGQMFAGASNPSAYYFGHTDPKGVRLFLEMKNSPSVDTMIEAMKANNATVTYFIIEKTRLGLETYNDVINKTHQNNLQTYKIFYYPKGEEKLRIFYYQSQSSTG